MQRGQRKAGTFPDGMLPVRMALWYAAASTAWVLLSDQLLVALRLPRPTETIVGSAKGFVFVVVTTLIMYGVTTRYVQRLRASEERYFRLFENASEGIVLYRLERDESGALQDLVIEDVNPAQSERSGIAREQAVGMRMSDADGLSEEMRAYFDVVRSAVSGGAPMRSQVHSRTEDSYSLVAAYPLARDVWAAGGVDITKDVKAQETLRVKEDQIRRAYVDVLDAVTGGKLVVMTEEEIDAELGTPFGGTGEVTNASDLAAIRDTIRETAVGHFPGVDVFSLLSAAGEALNNALKHAGGGTYRLYAKGDVLQAEVADEGPGIDFRTLPKATLLPGFSTAATLGMGFTMMLQLTERVLLSTRPGRSRVVLEVRRSAQ